VNVVSPSQPHRQPFDRDELTSALLRAGGLWTSLDVVDSVGSSNTELAGRAAQGVAGSGSVLVAEEQTAGRGRRGRERVAPERSSVMVSVLVEPEVDQAQWGWMPLLTSLAVTEAVNSCGVSAAIKWPNDVVVAESKIAGILCEVVSTPGGNAVVAGWGVNVDQDRDELPFGDATSVRLCGGAVDRGALLIDCLRALERWYLRWHAAAPTGGSVMDAYVERSSTLGRAVRVDLPDGSEIFGVAKRLDSNGHLVLDVEGAELAIAAADVVHLRPAGLRP
jgi:BirA family biotin operon repressor/biotin-[acetyl-CoA-carboxylase] ligase